MNESTYKTPESELVDNQQVQEPMSWQQLYFSFEGRVGRQTYWLKYVLPFFGVYFVLAMLAGFLFGGESTVGMLIVLVAQLAAIWPALAVTAKRWHDRDKSGWWSLISFVPLIGALWMLVENGILEGDAEANRFGSPEA